MGPAHENILQGCLIEPAIFSVLLLDIGVYSEPVFRCTQLFIEAFFKICRRKIDGFFEHVFAFPVSQKRF